jgi:2-oxoglutarate dehydrogenase E2 component (dihydrolipoamide succinyltransferase)
MLIDVAVPQLGESITEGTLSKWLVNEGDVVVKDQPLASIGTDKADSDLPSPVAGRIAKLLVAEGQVIPVKTVIAQIEEGAFATPSTFPATPVALSAAPGAPVSLPPVSVNVPRGAPLASPTVRKVALEQDVDLATVRGTGERGRLTKDDVLRAASHDLTVDVTQIATVHTPAPAPAAPPAPQQLAQMINAGGGFVPPIPGVGFGSFKVPPYRPHEGDKVVPFTRRRRITADHMTYSKVTSPHVVTVAEVDLHKCSKLRDANKERYKAEGMSLTMLAFVVVATAHALRENLGLNARVIDDAYVILRDINVGVAVDSPDGLVVPVIRRADELGVRGIVRAIDDLAHRARAGKITIDDLSGASFSVSNPGMKGNLFGGAIINQPNVGILRMGEIQKRTVVVTTDDGEDHIAIHPVMYVALSYDHRVVDGVAANAFLWRVTEILEKAELEV